VMRLPQELNGNVDAYSWSWAAAMLLSRYDDYRAAFMAAARNGRDSGPGFTRQLYRRLAPQWPIVKARWQVLCHELDYGFDWSRERVDLATSDPMWDGRPLRREVDAARGWQSVGARFPAGTRLSITAEGRCRIAETDGEPWVSEPQGVTLRYHRGRPLGQCLVCVLPCVSESQPTVQPLKIHGGRGPIDLQIADASWVLLRVNDAVGELAENEGEYAVTIRAD